MASSEKTTVSDTKTSFATTGFDPAVGLNENDLDLSWYARWMDRQLQKVPSPIIDNIVSLEAVWRHTIVLSKEHSNVQAIAENLVRLDLIKSSETLSALDTARAITFGILGWQSMLYEPELSIKPSSRIDIADTLNGYTGSAFASRTIYYPSFASQFPDLLIGFGLMLPKGNLCISQDDNDVEAFEKVGVITPGALNAFTLCKLAGVAFKWVDSMAPHLEYDRATHTVYLYRFPSFCLANINDSGDIKQNTTIYSLASDDPRNRRWASEEDITQFMREILLSYRLLFAQERASRIFFQAMKGPGRTNREDTDPFLSRICSAEQFDNPAMHPDRDSYWLNRDFPILRMRLAVLQHQLSSVKPTGWRAIWTDKRDSVQWYTFWAVILFGGVGLILATLQVIFQGIQTFHN